MKTFWGKILTLRGIHQLKTESLAKIGAEQFCVNIRKFTNINPNQITIFNIGVGILAWITLFNNSRQFLVILFVHKFLDAVDGYYARVTKTESVLGEKLDHWGDFGIGVLMLIKSFLHFGYWWILWLLVAFVGEMILIKIKGWDKDKFPTRMFLNFYLFGLYLPGLVVQLIFQPITIVVFMLRKGKDV